MKKLIIALSLAATFVATKSEAQTNSPAKSTEKGTKELVILHTNDTHSCIYPLNPQLADTLKAGRGGFTSHSHVERGTQKEPRSIAIR